ncbi:MAG: dicarboxylate/amino acid:cation symporter [Bryobacteraceae bacterium]|nr:dicarboxylate/amino acid:cation symporter [Bryobacteraceae bacterium]
MQLHNKILIGLAAGVAAGLLAKLARLDWLMAALVFVEPVGAAFIRLITMIVIPLIIGSIIVGAASLGDLRKLGRIGGKTVFYYLLTMTTSVILGLLLSNLIRPGSRIDPVTRDHLAEQFASQASAQLKLAERTPSIKDLLLDIIPRNPVKAAADFDLLPLIFFSLIFGAAISLVRSDDARAAVLHFFAGVNQASTIIIHWVMQLAPYAVFVLIAVVVARFGVDLLQSLLIYAVTVLLGLFLQTYVTLAILVRVFGRINPAKFFRRIAAAQLFAFSTSSSNATLPLSIETAETRLGISKSVSSFVLPLGATINMDGTALYQAVATMFIAQIYGVPMDLGAQLTIVLTATLASIGAAGVPSAGIITLIIVLQSVGLGARVESGIALILGVDRILDMSRTVVNVTGDLVCAVCVGRSEKAMNLPAEEPAPVAAREG